jgi:LysM repeat protein
MRLVRQLGTGLIYGLVSVLLVVGVLSLALAESYKSPHPTQTPASPAQPLLSPSAQPGFTLPSTGGTLPVPGTPAATNCLPPAGWILIEVQPGDTLLSLAYQYGVTATQLQNANCLVSSSRLIAESGIFVPRAPTQTVTSCHPFPGWIHAYIVQPGDTLYHIALLYGTTVDRLKFANCRTGNEIFPGERLWVPNVPIATPGMTIIPDFSTPSDQPTLPLTITALPFTETSLATSTSFPPSATATETLSSSPSPTP